MTPAETAARSDLARITTAEFVVYFPPSGATSRTSREVCRPRISSGPSRFRSATASATSSCT